MKSLFLLSITVILFVRGKSDLNVVASKDCRKIFFYVWDKTTPRRERTIKKMDQISDSLKIARIKLICTKGNHIIDTVRCQYTGDKIYFNSVDTTENKIVSLYILCEIKAEKGKKGRNEIVVIPFETLFYHTNESSTASISLERDDNHLFHIQISKLDFPYMVSIFDVTAKH